MGNWDVLHHLFECTSTSQAESVYAQLRDAEKHSWIDSTRWGLRFGYKSPTLLMASTSQKWGWDRDFSGFITKKAPDIVVRQLISEPDDDEAEIHTPSYCKQELSFRLRWDTIYWHSRAEIDWSSSPVQTVQHPPPHDLESRLRSAIPGLRPIGTSKRIFCLPMVNVQQPPDGGLCSEHLSLLSTMFSVGAKSDIHTEDVTYILIGTRSKRHGLLYWGYIGIEGDCASYNLSLGGNRLSGEQWRGPYTTPIQDDLFDVSDDRCTAPF